MSFTANIGLQVMQGKKVVEVGNQGQIKGNAGSCLISKDCYDLILATEDDGADEAPFKTLPESAYSIKVGMAQSRARFNLHGPEEMLWVRIGFAVDYNKNYEHIIAKSTTKYLSDMLYVLYPIYEAFIRCIAFVGSVLESQILA
jgi:trehalose-6-phosphatase